MEAARSAEQAKRKQEELQRKAEEAQRKAEEARRKSETKPTADANPSSEQKPPSSEEPRRRRRRAPGLKGSIGDRPNHSNFSHQNSVEILVRIQEQFSHFFRKS